MSGAGGWGSGCVNVEVRGQPRRTGSLLPPCGSKELDSGHQAWQHVSLPAEPSSAFSRIFAFCIILVILLLKKTIPSGIKCICLLPFLPRCAAMARWCLLLPWSLFPHFPPSLQLPQHMPFAILSSSLLILASLLQGSPSLFRPWQQLSAL